MRLTDGRLRQQQEGGIRLDPLAGGSWEGSFDSWPDRRSGSDSDQEVGWMGRGQRNGMSPGRSFMVGLFFVIRACTSVWGQLIAVDNRFASPSQQVKWPIGSSLRPFVSIDTPLSLQSSTYGPLRPPAPTGAHHAWHLNHGLMDWVGLGSNLETRKEVWYDIAIARFSSRILQTFNQASKRD